ncbi:MAG TPA: branched-chain amino acid ABC transporter substrate-binding protein [Candidatus Limnocylindrales bacterium]
MQTRRMASWAGALIISAALIGCSSSPGASPTGAGQQSGAPASASAGGTYKLGVPIPQTGSEAQSGTTIFNGIKLAVDQINAAGGLLGNKIEIVAQDDACDPQTSVNAANKLVSQGVQAVVGAYCSSAALPAIPIYERAGIPNLQPSANSTKLTATGAKNLFLLDPTGNFQAALASDFFLKVLKAKNVLIADDQSTYSVDVAKLASDAITKAGGTVLPIQAVPNTAQDFSAVITTIRSRGADAVYWTGYYAQAALFVRQLRGAGLNIPFVTADGSVDPTFITNAGAANAEGAYGTIATTTQFLTGSEAQKFISDYKTAFGADPGPYSAYGYDAMMALAAAVKAANSVDPAKVIEALHALKVDGLTGSVSFAADGSREGAKFVVLQVIKGAYQMAPTQP